MSFLTEKKRKEQYDAFVDKLVQEQAAYKFIRSYYSLLNSLPNDKIYVNLNVTQKLNFVLGRAENIVGKGENAGQQYFSLPTIFSKAFFLFTK